MMKGMLVPLMLMASVFLLATALGSDNAYALEFLNANFNFTDDVQSLTMNQLGGLVQADCTCPLLDPFCWWQCIVGSGNYSETACFGDLGHYSVFDGAQGVGYYNNTCLISNYQSLGIYAENPSGTTNFTNPFPDRPMTIYAQVRYQVSDWDGADADPSPFLAFVDADSLETLPAQKNLTLVDDEWVVTTIWTTFPANATFRVGWFLPQWYNMTPYWKVYFDYFRVGYVDQSSYVSAEPSTAQKMADCGYANGTYGFYCDSAKTTYDNDANESVYVSIETFKLGDDSGSDLFCQTWYSNQTLEGGLAGTYVVRMPMEMNYTNYSSDTGEYHFSYGGMTSATNVNAYWCYMLAKDYLYYSSYHSYFVWQTGYGVCSCDKYATGVFDTLSNDSVRLTSLGHEDWCRNPNGKYDSSSYWDCGCSGSPTASQPCSACNPTELGGNIDFGSNGTIYGSVPINNVTFVADSNIWVPYTNPCTDCCYATTNGTLYFREQVPSSYLSAWNVSGDQWKARVIGVAGNNNLFSSGWLDGYYYSFGRYFPNMWNGTCEVGWSCNGTYEYYTLLSCDTVNVSSCGGCGCSGDRCRSEDAHWECLNSTVLEHYNSTCDLDVQLICDYGCTNFTEPAHCVNETNCVEDSDCTPYCVSPIFYSNGVCNLFGYTCDYDAGECPYGCNDLGCIGVSTEPLPISSDPLETIGLVGSGMLAFLGVVSTPFLGFIFVFIVAVIIISLFGVAVHIITRRAG